MIANHEEAYQLACLKREESNLARAYLELKARCEALWYALIPTTETKAAFLGAFHFETEHMDAEGNPYVQRYTVPWTTIKEIMTAIRTFTHSPTPPALDKDARIAELERALNDLVNTPALSSVEKLVKGWDGPDEDAPNEPHPVNLGAQIKTTCGRMYALNHVMKYARAALAPRSADGKGE
jgi:hypothetical protein